jgi:hypothetical protein
LRRPDLERTKATNLPEEANRVKMGLRSILLLAAVVVFLVAIFIDKNQFEWQTAGLALFAASFFVGDGGLRIGGRRRL